MKQILIMLLLVIILFFIAKSCNSDSVLYKENLKEFATNNDKLDKKIKISDSLFSILQKDYFALQKKDSALNAQIAILDDEVERRTSEAKKTQEILFSLQRQINNTRKQIDSIKRNPPNRTEGDLLNSLKMKTIQ
jgi:peptidoglycan hydrolase CwlO-like protein